MTTRSHALFAAAGLAIMALACEGHEQSAFLQADAVLAMAGTETMESADPRRVWANARSNPDPSPDGRYVTYEEWITGDVGLHEFATGTDRRLTDKGDWPENDSFAERPHFSPDSREVVFTYWNARAETPGGWRLELRIVSLNDTTTRLVLPVGEEEVWIEAIDWTEEAGILVAVARGEERRSELGLVDPASGALRVLKTMATEEGYPNEGAISPDGSLVVYKQGDDLRVIRTDGTGDRSLGRQVRWLLGWAPSGDGVLVHASMNDITGIWLLPISADGQPGELRLVRDGMTAFLPGGMAGSSYFYIIPVDAPQVTLMSVDVSSGQVLSPPVAITSPLQGFGRSPRWSPDGRTLAYILEDDVGGVVRIMLRAADGDEVRQLIEFESEVWRVSGWAPDGQTIYVGVRDSEFGWRQDRINVRTGEVEASYRDVGQFTTVAPDGSLIHPRFGDDGDGEPEQMVALDPESGEERVLFETRDHMHRPGEVSPDGRFLAVILGTQESGETRVVIVPLDGSGPPREIARASYPQHWHERRPINWTPDGRYVLANLNGWEGIQPRIFAIPVDGGTPILVLQAQGQRGHDLHPDGRRMAYWAGEQRGEMWVLDDLTPRGR